MLTTRLLALVGGLLLSVTVRDNDGEFLAIEAAGRFQLVDEPAVRAEPFLRLQLGDMRALVVRLGVGDDVPPVFCGLQ